MYDIEQLCEFTGYKKNTLYNLCNDLNIDGIKGKIPGNPGKALYSSGDLFIIQTYQSFLSGNTKAVAIEKTLEVIK